MTKQGNHNHKTMHGIGSPSIMEDRFRQMPGNNPSLFIIKHLDAKYSPIEFPTTPIRTRVHCFILLKIGEVLATIGDDNYLIKANECVIIPAGQVFAIKYWRECSGYMGAFHTDFLTADIYSRNIIRSFPMLRSWSGHKITLGKEKSIFITAILERLTHELKADHNEEILKTYLNTLLVEIDQVFQKTYSTEDLLDHENSICNRFVEDVFTKPVLNKAVKEYAQDLGISLPVLQKSVKKITGKTPQQWINEAVLLEAKVLLLHTDLTISEVADNMGITDPSYFTRFFRKHVGMPPGTYRSEFKNPKKG